MFDTKDYATIPEGLDDMKPGPNLASHLASISVTELSGHDRIVLLRAHQRLASYYTARVYEDMAGVSDAIHELDDDYELANEEAEAEIRAALCLTRRAADHELSFALDLRQRLPQVWKLLATGDIDIRRARAIIYATSHLTIAQARDVVDTVIEEAPRLTTGQIMARIRRLCIETDPQDASDRYQHGLSGRRVVTEPTNDGTVHLLGLDLPPHRVAAIMRKINRIARSLRSASESRSMDQLRADVLLDLLLDKPHTHQGPPGGMEITVDLATLTRLSEGPGELAGYGPVIADIARQITTEQENTQWRYTITHPTTGRPLHNGITRRRPTNRQRRDVHAQHPTCVFPGCRMPAQDCDLDHRIPYSEGGPTTTPNLAPLCRHDHRIRTLAGWNHQLLPNGDHQWTTKLGHTYTTNSRSP